MNMIFVHHLYVSLFHTHLICMLLVCYNFNESERWGYHVIVHWMPFNVFTRSLLLLLLFFNPPWGHTLCDTLPFIWSYKWFEIIFFTSYMKYRSIYPDFGQECQTKLIWSQIKKQTHTFTKIKWVSTMYPNTILCFHQKMLPLREKEVASTIKRKQNFWIQASIWIVWWMVCTHDGEFICVCFLFMCNMKFINVY